MSDRTNKAKTIVVEGNIGSGKSTLVQYLSKQSHVYDVLLQPIDEWTHFNGFNLLDMMYSNPNRWSFIFQYYVHRLLSRLHKKPSEKTCKVIEGSIHSCRYCFTENLNRSRILHQVEYHLLDEQYSEIIEDASCNVDLIIYLRSDPQVCLHRIKTRNRREEQSTVDLDLLQSLDDLYERWITSDTCRDLRAPVLLIDANQTKENVFNDLEQYLKNWIVSSHQSPSTSHIIDLTRRTSANENVRRTNSP